MAFKKLETSISTIGTSLTDENIAKVEAIERVFTIAYENKLASLTDHFKGIFADAASRDAVLTSPISGNYCKQNDTDSFWFYGASWVDSGSNSIGDMLMSTYDPQGVASDTFDRANHTGMQEQSTIDGLNTVISELKERLARLEAFHYNFLATYQNYNWGPSMLESNIQAWYNGKCSVIAPSAGNSPGNVYSLPSSSGFRLWLDHDQWYYSTNSWINMTPFPNGKGDIATGGSNILWIAGVKLEA